MQSMRSSRFAPRSRATYDTASTGLPSDVRSNNAGSGLGHQSNRRGTVDARAYADSDATSTSSMSSAGSSMRGRSNQSTPRTSVDSDDYAHKHPESDSRDSEANADADQEGNSWFWSKVNNLTVSVSKAWTADAEVLDGEATPAGEESRLTKAMKAYHLEKANNPSDLPEWLFSEQERFPGRARPSADRVIYEEPEEQPTHIPTRQTASRSRTMHDAALDPPARVARSNTFDEENAAPSRATNRLRAMRDAKRQPIGASAGRSDNGAPDARARGGYEPEGSPAPERSAIRTGLPTGPMRSGRF